jgi:CRP-like cAMP-binding protein
MWGDEASLRLVRERMKLLMEIHHQELRPRQRTAREGELLLSQGEEARSVLLLVEGRVAVQLRQLDQQPHTLAVIEAEELLGEMGLFGTGRHSTDVRVVGGDARLVEVNGDEFLRTLLFDVDLAIELLALVSQRCMRSNEVIGLLLDGITAAERGDQAQLERFSAAVQPLDHGLARAADHLRALGEAINGRRNAPAS